MNLYEQVKLHKEISQKIDELENQKKALGIAIMEQMQGKILNLPGFVVRRYNRLSIKLTIEEARGINAIKMEEAVDKDKVKTMFNNGQIINGVSEIQYIQVNVKKE